MGSPIDILIDARVTERGHTGIARYVRELLPHLAADGAFRLTTLLTGSGESLDGAADRLNVRTPFLAPAEQVELPLRVAAWKRGRPGRSVFWVPAYNAPCLAPGPLVLTIHDANHLALAHQYSPAHVAYYRSVVRLSCLRARAVLAPSEFARQEVIDRIGVDAAKVVTTPLAVTPPPVPSEQAVSRVRAAHGLGGAYVAYVGNFKPHKNLPVLLEAARAFAREVPLVLVGGREAELGEPLRRAQAEGLRVVVVPSLPDADLWALLAGASVFAFPSLYEGFGLPPLEAMALGVPVVTTTAASLPEVAGDAALTVAPTDAEAMGQAIRRVLDDRNLAAELSARGRQRAAARTWADVARETGEVLRRAAG